MRRIVVIIAAVIILTGSLFLIFGENGLHLKKVHVRDIIGTSIERENLEQVDLLSNIFVRTIDIENKKLDFLLQSIGNSALTRFARNSGDSSVAQVFMRFKREEPACRKIQLIDQNGTVLYSTDDNDTIGTVLNDVLRVRLFEHPGRAPLLSSFSPEGSLLFSRYPTDQTDTMLLFYYSKALLENAFKDIDGIGFQSLSIPAPGIAVLNFPVVENGNEANLKMFSDSLAGKTRGAVRIQAENFDKTVYFVHAPQPLPEWVVAIAYDTEKIGISSVGILVLIIQAVVILAIVIFVFTTIRMRRISIARVKHETVVEEGTEVTVAEAVQKTEDTVRMQEHVEPLPVAEEEMGVPVLETGVIPLEAVEEVVDLEEVGEAEIAEELEELEEVSEGELAGEGEDAGTARAAGQEVGEAEIAEELEELEEVSEGELAGEGEDAGTAHAADQEAGEAEKAEAHQKPAINTTPPEKEGNKKREMRNSSSDSSVDNQLPAIEESITDDSADVLRKGAEGSSLPELETLVGTTYESLKEVSEKSASGEAHNASDISEEVMPEIPDEAYEEHTETKRDDELADLIQTIETENMPVVASGVEKATEIFKSFLIDLDLTKGALLLLNRENVYKPVFVHGFSKKTEKKLVFMRDEKIITDILRKDRILFVREDAFMSSLLRTKFDTFDSATIKRLFLAGVIRSREVEDRDGTLPMAILLVCLTAVEAAQDTNKNNIIVKELKNIKKKISNIV